MPKTSRHSVIEPLRVIYSAAEKAPRLGRTIVNGSLACALWPVAALPPRPLHGEGAPPIVVLGARNDPATPFAWAKGLASELESATFVPVRSARHTSFNGGNDCVDRLVVRYLVNPLIESTARESMARTLVTLKARFANPARPAGRRASP